MGKWASEAQRLEAFLAKSEQEGRLPVERGALNRRAIARELGVPYHALFLSIDLAPIVEGWNSRLARQGFTGSKYDLLADKVRAWLEEQWACGTVPVESGIVIRKAIAAALDFPIGQFSRNTALRDVVRRFDARVTAEGLPDSRIRTALALLENIESRWRASPGSVPLYRGRINRVEVGRLLKFSPQELSQVPQLSTALDKADREFADPVFGAGSEPLGEATSLPTGLNPYVAAHKRWYHFSDLEGSFGSAFLRTLASGFARSVSGLVSGKAQYRGLRGILELIAARPDEFADLIAAARQTGQVPAEAWERAAWAWRDEVAARVGASPLKDAGAHALIKAARRALDLCADMGVLPRVRALRGIRGARAKAQARPVLAAAEPAQADPIFQALQQAAATVDVRVEPEEARMFLANIAAERAGRTDLPTDPVQAIRQINQERLDALRRCAEADFQLWSGHLEEGRRLLSEADIAPDQIAAFFAGGDRPRDHAGGPFSEKVPLRLRQARYLAYVDYAHGGLVPRADPDIIREYGQVFSKLHRSLGNSTLLEAFLNPHPHALTAAMVLYLVESGSNLAVGRGLPADYWSPSDLPGHRTVSGTKARARGKAIVSDLPVKDKGRLTAVQALDRLKEMSARYRAAARGETAGLLFLHRPQSAVKPLSEHLLTTYFAEFLDRHETLRGLKITPSMIRPSVLMQRALNDDGSIKAAQILGQHASADTTDRSYTGAWPIRELRQRKIREFMRLYQMASIAGVEGAASKLGIAVADAAILFERAMRTGLGTACLLPNAGLQPGTRAGETCHALDGCVGCKAQIVTLEPDLIADLLLWQESLIACRTEWEAERHDRWAGIWLPWLAFCDVVVEQMKRGPEAAILRRARALADQIKSRDDYVAPKPW